MKTFKPEVFLSRDLNLEEIQKLPNEFTYEKVVLGIDVYKYSQYPRTEQIFIPVIFEKLYSDTVFNICKHEPFLFDSYGKSPRDFKSRFISTGDGGFQIFDNEIQAITFALYFQMLLKRFCTGGGISNITKNLFKIVNSIDTRFAISRDMIYSYKGNFFGPSIINNSRILSKDNLNRFLIDANSIKWLSHNINAPENLLVLDKKSLLQTEYFGQYNGEMKSMLFDESGKIITLDLLKVGKITAKDTKLDVFNLHIQAKLDINVDHHQYSTYIITLGNLNTSGIN